MNVRGRKLWNGATWVRRGEVGLVNRRAMVIGFWCTLIVGAVIERAKADHPPCPGCGACCVNGPVGIGCVETTPDDCVFNFGGNPQEVGTDCHDFDFDGTADACEPGFPLCVPDPAGTACANACPGPLNCSPTKVRYSPLLPVQPEVLECSCGTDCAVDLSGQIPVCTNGCLAFPTIQECEGIEQFFGVFIDLECRCAPTGACCLSDYSCEIATQHKCVINGGVYLGDDTACGNETGACCYDLDADGIPENCTIADATCCTALLGGIYHGAGSNCAGVGACCFGITGGGCAEVDKICCDDIIGSFQGQGTVCLGDNNGNGLDDACEGGGGACQPAADGQSCVGTCLPNEFCRPKTIRREIDGSFHITECECRSTFDPITCGISFDPLNGPVSCGGGCGGLPASCTLFTTGHLDGTIDYQCRCADLVAPCSPTADLQGCTGPCFDDAVACTPDAIRINVGAAPVVESCDCQSPRDCRPFVNQLGNTDCLNSCQPGQSCSAISSIDEDGNVVQQCNCLGNPVQACCLPMAAVTCQELSINQCNAIGGTPQGPFSTCLGHEACCLPGGLCTFVDRICCDDLGGTPLGAGSQCEGDNNGDGVDDACDELGACCLDNYGCAQTNENDCVLMGGVFLGIGLPCGLESGACCYDLDGDGVNESCAIANSLCCTALLNGTPHAAGTTCGGTVPCCFDVDDGPIQYDTCFEMDALCCSDAFGIPGNPGFCETEACCVGGVCGEIEADCCLASGGIPHGPGSTCVDADGSGAADVCEDCKPVLAGTSCNPTACPALSQDCRPVMIQCAPIGASCTILDCDCVFMGGCHVDVGPFGLPMCFGGCPNFPEACELQMQDTDGDGIDDLFFCRCGPDLCAQHTDCDDFNVCTCDLCPIGLGICNHFPIEFGDTDCQGPPVPNLDDILCTLRGFTEFAQCPNADLHPFCVGDNDIDIDDILAVLRAFSGFDPCGCP